MAANKGRDETPTRLKHTNGAVSVVPAYKAERLVAAGLFTKVTASSSTGYSAQRVGDLKAEIERRNADRDPESQLSSEGNKADLVAVLEADDASAGE